VRCDSRWIYTFQEGTRAVTPPSTCTVDSLDFRLPKCVFSYKEWVRCDNRWIYTFQEGTRAVYSLHPFIQGPFALDSKTKEKKSLSHH
jgi:hypothetical protein